MPFDVAEALKAGYSQQEIATFLGEQKKFDTQKAFESGYSPDEVISFLNPKEQTTGERLKRAAVKGFEAIPESAAGIGLGVSSALGLESTGKQAEAIRKEAKKEAELPQGITWDELEKTYGTEGAFAALKKFPTYVAEQILQSAPSMAIPLAAGAAGAALSGPLAPIVGPIAGIGAYSVQQFGQFMQRQAQEGATPETLAPGKAALAAAATAPIGYFADRFTLGMSKVPTKVLGEEISKELAKRTSGVAGRAATGASLGIIAEAPTEVLEQAAERWQAGLDLTGEEAKKEYKEAFFGAAAVGGVGGAAARVLRGAPTEPEVAPPPVAPPPYVPEPSITGTNTADMIAALSRPQNADMMAAIRGREAEQAAQAEAQRVEEERAAAETKRLEDEAQRVETARQMAARERVRAMPGFTGADTTNADILQAVREKQEAEAIALEKGKEIEYRKILGTTFSSDPLQNFRQQQAAIDRLDYTTPEMKKQIPDIYDELKALPEEPDTEAPPVTPPVTPITPPVAPVVEPIAPVAPPVTAPIAPPVAPPVAAPVAAPIAPPVAPPVIEEQQPVKQDKSLASQPTYTESTVLEVPVPELTLSKDVPQFKSDANQNGVVQATKLEGKFDRRLASPVQVWQRNNGQLEVISGRHRLDLAQRSGEKTISAQIYKESEGFNADMARMLDIELNVKDGRGKVKDYVSFFKEFGLPKEQARAEGLLNTAIGRQAYEIADAGSPSLIAAHFNKDITDDAATAIAINAPKDEALQNLGMQQVRDGKSINHAVNFMRSAMAAGFKGKEGSGDLFGFDDSFAKEAEAVTKEATKQQREARQQLSAIKGAAKSPEKARLGGVDVKNLEQTQAKIAELEKTINELENFHTNPELYKKLRQAAGLEVAEVAPAVEEVTTPAEEASEIKDLTIRDKLKRIAKNIGVKVFETGGGYSAGSGVVSIPTEDRQVEGAQTPEHVFAHELGHAVMQNRQMSYNGMPNAEVEKWIKGWSGIKNISKSFRPEMHKHPLPKFKRHANKPDEIIADALGSFFLGESSRQDIQPIIKAMNLNDFDLGLKEKPSQELVSPTPESLKAQEERAKSEEKRIAAEKKAAEDKAKADAEVGEYKLAGSDRAADVAEAAGQTGLFEAKPAAPKQQSLVYRTGVGDITKMRIFTEDEKVEFNEVSGQPQLVILGQNIAGTGENAIVVYHNNRDKRGNAFDAKDLQKVLDIDEGMVAAIQKWLASDSKTITQNGQKLAKELSDFINAASGVKQEQKIEEKAPPELDTSGLKEVKGRHPQIQAAAKLLQEGKMTREKFEEYVDYYKPIETIQSEKLLAPTSEQKMNETVNADKRDKINAEVKDGEKVGLRMDLPARERGGSVVSIHEGKAGKQTIGKLKGFRSTGWLKDVTFEVRSQEKGLAVAAGASKAPQQTVEGTWFNLSPEETYAKVKQLMKDPAWSQIGFDPSRHGYFYDRKTRQPVTSASEMYQVGQFLLAKDVKYESKEKFLYSLRGKPEKQVTAFQETLRNLLNKFGLKDVGVNLIEGMRDEGSYASKLIQIAADSANPIRTLRHEAIHALRELGFFTEGQWKSLSKMAKDKWIDQYLKQRNVDGKPLKAGEESRYDAYMREYKGDMEKITEEAVADAFADFESTKPPAGMLQSLLKRLSNLFQSIKSALTKIEAPEQIFAKVEKGALKPEAERAPSESKSLRTSVESLKESAQKFLQTRQPLDREALSHVQDEDFKDALGTVFNPQRKTVIDKVEGMKDGFWRRVAQGVADQYRTIKDYDPVSYMLARLSKTVDGALEGLMLHGHVFNDGGALNIRQNTKGMLEALKPLGKEVDSYQMWIALNRESKLPPEKRSPNISALVPNKDLLVQGTLNGKPRLEVYQSVQKDMNALNKSVLDVALNAGIINSSAKDIAAIRNRTDLTDQQKQDKIDKIGRPSKEEIAKILARTDLTDEQKQKQIRENKPGAYEIFSNDIFYIPFYKEMEDGDVQSSASAAGLDRQKFSAELKGMTDKPFGDLMENTLRNWSHILSASMKNQAANSTINATMKAGATIPNMKVGLAYRDGVVYSTKNDEVVGDGVLRPEQTSSEGKGMVKIMRDGHPMYFEVLDPMLLESIISIGYMGPKSKFLEVARDFKNVLQFGVTISPTFKVNNLIRDSISAMAVSDLKKNPFANIAEGWAASRENNPAHIAALAGGAVFNFGSTYEGDQARLVKQLIKQGVRPDSILDSPEKIKAGMKLLWDKYQEFGNRSEAANRLALYNQLRADRKDSKGNTVQGMGHMEASFQARDLLDFSMQGSWQAFRTVTMVVPFLNARVQGLYKLGRDGITPTTRVLYNTVTGKQLWETDANGKLTQKGLSDKQIEQKKAYSFGVTTSAVALASMALYMAFKDDEDFQKRDEWDRDNFWWIKIPGMEYALRVPKPFEVGAFGTLAERTLEQIVDQGSEGKQFGSSIGRMLFDTFALNPTPQMFKPLIDLYANKDSFTGAPIESAGMERLSKQERATDTTSPIAKLVGGMSSFLGEKGELSPVQVDYAIKSYFGWLGATAATTSMYATMPFREGAYPDTVWMDKASLGLIKTLPSNQSRYTTAFYESNKDISQAFADMRHFAEAGESEKVERILEEKGDKIALAKFYDKTAKSMANIRKQIRMITNDESMSGADKREEIDRMKEIISMLSKQAEDTRKAMK